MTEVCILFRAPDGRVRALLNPAGDVKVWPDRDAALAALAEQEKILLRNELPWQLVELDEL